MIELSSCWDPLRPVGINLLEALVFPEGLAILNHFLLLIFSILITSTYCKKNGPKLLLYKSIFIFSIFEALFCGLASVNLSDIVAGFFASVAIVAFSRNKFHLFSILSSISASLRAIYLYPMLILIIFSFGAALYKKNNYQITSTIPFFIIISPQYLLTYFHTKHFSFLHPVEAGRWISFHLESNFAGYDSLLSAKGYYYQSGVSSGLISAIKNQSYVEIFNLLIARMHFYFSSYVPWGQVYLDSSDQRFFSLNILYLNFLGIFLFFLYLKRHFFKVFIPLLLILIQALFVIPEQRFIFPIHLFITSFACLYFFSLIENKYKFLYYK